MNIKILVTAIGQHIIAGVKVIENTETQVRVAYWVQQPRIIVYRQGEEGKTNLNLVPYCLASDENEFSISENHVVAILEPRDDILEAYREQVFSSEVTEVTELEGVDEVDQD